MLIELCFLEELRCCLDELFLIKRSWLSRCFGGRKGKIDINNYMGAYTYNTINSGNKTMAERFSLTFRSARI